MTQHTPGPWLDIHDASEQASGVIRLVTAAGIVDSTEDDIALMMLAPELLAALTELLGAYESVMQSEFNYPGDPWSAESRNDAEALKAQRLIALAKGLQP